MADFTATQGRYLAFISAYTDLHGYPPAESEIAAAMCVSPPSVNQMVKSLERKGLIERRPGEPRSVRVLVPENELPPWGNRKPARRPARHGETASHLPAQGPSAASPANLYVFSVFLMGGPVSEKLTNKEISRVIEIRGDQTLEQLHRAIFKAYDRWEEHCYEFQFGKRPFDPAGPNYGVTDPEQPKNAGSDARVTKLDELDLKRHRVFGYWFDFGDDWYHQVQLERIEQAIPTVAYPRVIKRVGKSPPQYCDESSVRR
jgi:hypothetical protein